MLHHRVFPFICVYRGHIFHIGFPGEVLYQAMPDCVVSVSLTRRLRRAAAYCWWLVRLTPWQVCHTIKGHRIYGLGKRHNAYATMRVIYPGIRGLEPSSPGHWAHPLYAASPNSSTATSSHPTASLSTLAFALVSATRRKWAATWRLVLDGEASPASV